MSLADVQVEGDVSKVLCITSSDLLTISSQILQGNSVLKQLYREPLVPSILPARHIQTKFNLRT